MLHYNKKNLFFEKKDISATFWIPGQKTGEKKKTKPECSSFHLHKGKEPLSFTEKSSNNKVVFIPLRNSILKRVNIIFVKIPELLRILVYKRKWNDFLSHLLRNNHFKMEVTIETT